MSTPRAPHRLTPAVVTSLRHGYTGAALAADSVAGVVVGLVAVPLALAFALASGVRPEQGLYTAAVAGAVAAMAGGSRYQVTGPTGAFIVVVYGIVERHGYPGLAAATVMAGVLLVAAGLAGAGRVLRYVPFPLTVGFTSGIALVIFSSQVADLLGLRVGKLPAHFVEKWGVLLPALPSARLPSVLLSAACLGALFYWPKVTRRVPGPLVVLAGATFVTWATGLPVETVGTRFGAVPGGLPAWTPPDLGWRSLEELAGPAMTIALLGGIESLLSAVVADGMTGGRHRPDAELVAQGLAGVVTPFFGGIPATGAIARTAVNIKCGARSPVAALVHAAVVGVVVVAAGPAMSAVPVPALAAILTYVAYNMSEWRVFVHVFRYPKGDVAVLLVTFFLTVLFDLTVAIGAGMTLAAFLFVRRMETLARVDEAESEEPLPEGVRVFTLYGPLFFSAVERFKRALARLEEKPAVLVLDFVNVPVIDGTGLEALAEAVGSLRASGGRLVLAGLGGQAKSAVLKSRLAGGDDLFSSLDEALVRLRPAAVSDG